MNLLAPAGLFALLLLPIIVAIHLWRVRYRRYVLSSTLLWSRVLSETPLRRPRRLPTHILLLALQLAAVTGAVVALARPAWIAGGAHRHLVVAVDTSLVMGATDVPGSRLARAKDAVQGLIDGLAPGDAMTLVDVGAAPRVLATSDDHAALRRAVGALAQGYGPSSLGQDGPLLSGLMATGGRDAEAYLFAPLGTPRGVVDALSASGRWSLGSVQRQAQKGPLRFCAISTAYCLLLVGTSTDDRAVAGLTVSCAPGSATQAATGGGATANATGCEAYARLINTAAHSVTTHVSASVDGARLDESVSLAARSSAPIGLALPAGAHTVELRLDGHDPLPADDAAWAVVPLPIHRTVLVVTTASTSPGDPGAALLQALQAIPNVTLKITTPDAYNDDMARHADLTVLDNVGDTTSAGIDPPSNILLINPTGSTTLVTLDGTIAAPGVTAVRPNDPLLRGVDLSSLVVSSAARVPLPPWAHADVESGSGPLLFRGISGGRRVAALLFDPRTTANSNPSNLDTLLAFPTLLQNAVEELAPAPPLAVPAGQVAAIPVARQGPAWLRSPEGNLAASNSQNGPRKGISPAGGYWSLQSSGDLAALPTLRPGLYTFGGAAGGAEQPVAANVAVPNEPSASSYQPPAVSPPAPAAPQLSAPFFVTPWEGWAILAMVALLVLSGEWWYYVRRT